MANPKQNATRKYNWDDLDVGNINADNSEKFFTGERHTKHELLSTYWKSKENINLSGITPLVKMQESLQTEIDQAVAVLKMPLKNVLCDANYFGQVSVKANCRSITVPPKAYCFKDIYQQKKEQLVIKQREAERRMREFHSRPMPNFQAYHKQLAKRPFVHRVTCPVTPNTLKISRANEQKRKLSALAQKAAEAELLRTKPKKKVRTTSYLQEQPFVPKKAQTVLEIKPFCFSTEKRAQARKQLKEQMRVAQEALQKQIAERGTKMQKLKQSNPLRKSISFDSVFADQLKEQMKMPPEARRQQNAEAKQPTNVNAKEQLKPLRKSISLQSVIANNPFQNLFENPFLGLLNADFQLFHL